MSKCLWFVTACLLLVGARVSAEDKKDAPAAGGKPALEKMKKLAGEWYIADKDGKPTTELVSVFKVTGAGSAVHETIFPGSPHEMVTMYHLDGNDLVLTHYCAAGNQPHLKLDASSPANQLVFKFLNGTNIDPAKDHHMHEGAITLVDNDHIDWTWLGYSDGKPDEGHKVALKLVRKK